MAKEQAAQPTRPRDEYARLGNGHAADSRRPEPSLDARERGRSLSIGAAVFISGAVLLGVEIAASRVLAPFFGNSLFVWGALIGVVLTGLAVGYWIGGALADRFPVPGLLASVMAVAAVLVLAVPFVDNALVKAVVSWNPGPRSNPLVAAVLLFGLPSVVLAGVTPIAVRLRGRSVSDLGKTSGRLFALSTAGSIAGTFATAFWLIPELGTNQLFALAAAGLMAAVAVVALAERMALPGVVALAGVAAAAVTSFQIAPKAGATLTGAALRNWSPQYVLSNKGGAPVEDPALRVLYAKDTRYHQLTVADDRDSRYLRFNATFQSGMYLKQPFRTRFRYTDFFNLGFAYKPETRRVLFIGLGGGSAPKRVWRDFREVRIDVAELDPDVVDVGYRFFRVPRSPRLRIAAEDGRRYLARTQQRWDVIALDAYYADSVPFHLATREFLELVRSRLTPGGVLATNVIGAISGEGSGFFRALYRTYRSVFPTVLVHPVALPGEEKLTDTRNIILVATDQPAPQRGFLLERWRDIRREARTAPDLTRPIRDRYDGPVKTRDVPVLTDDYAPTDALLLFQ